MEAPEINAHLVKLIEEYYEWAAHQPIDGRTYGSLEHFADWLRNRDE